MDLDLTRVANAQYLSTGQVYVSQVKITDSF
jgi:hypothetical protein